MKEGLLIGVAMALMFVAGVFIGTALEPVKVRHVSTMPGSPGIMTKRIQVDGVDYVCSCQRWGTFRLEELAKKLNIPVEELRNLILEQRCKD
jgi:hypothetical protein